MLSNVISFASYKIQNSVCSFDYLMIKSLNKIPSQFFFSADQTIKSSGGEGCREVEFIGSNNSK